jgi:fatty acid-binding protein DegV
MIGGKLIAGKKYLGNLKKVITAYVKDTLGSIQPDLKRIFITFTEIDKDIIDKVETIIRETFSFASVIKTVAGATITSHCGKGTLGVLFYNA